MLVSTIRGSWKTLKPFCGLKALVMPTLHAIYLPKFEHDFVC